MADVIGILGFALHAAHKVYNVIQSIQDAPSDVRALRDNAFQVHGFLEDLLDKQAKGDKPMAAAYVDLREIWPVVQRAIGELTDL